MRARGFWRSARARALAAVVFVPLAVVVWWLAAPLFLSQTVQEDFPLPTTAVLPPNATPAETQPTASATAKPGKEMGAATPAAGSPIAVKSGALRDADAFHTGSGQATIYRIAADVHVLRLENIAVTNGPDLRVILSPHPSPTAPDEVTGPGSVELGKLKGNIGSQNYDLPRGVDVAALRSVVIFCWPFRVIFSVAPLESPPARPVARGSRRR